jgi:hypothetical protein
MYLSAFSSTVGFGTATSGPAPRRSKQAGPARISRALVAEIAAQSFSGNAPNIYYDHLLKAPERESPTLASLATRMRISQQTKRVPALLASRAGSCDAAAAR